MTSTTLPRRHGTRGRSTVPLSGTHRSTHTHLSFAAALAAQYAVAWHLRTAGLRVTESAVVRHALIRYAESLAERDPHAEFRAVRSASEDWLPDEGDQLMAELRLAAVPLEEPLPAWRVVRWGADALAAVAQIAQKAEELADRVIASRPPRRCKTVGP